MTDFFVKPVPLPIPRPSGLETEYPPSTDAGMPFKWPEKAADAFSEGVRYPPSGEGVKRISELPRGLEGYLVDLYKNGEELVVNAYGWLDEKYIPSMGFTDKLLWYLLFVSVVILGYSWVEKKFRKD